MGFKIHCFAKAPVKAFSLFFFALFLIGTSCAAQSAPPDLNTEIDRQIRTTYHLSPELPVKIGPFSPSTEWPGYDAFTLTIGNPNDKQSFDFLISKDRKSMLKVTKFDLLADPYAEVMKKVDLHGRPTRGIKSSKVTLVVFDDLQCPYCTMMHQALFPELLKEYGDRVTFIYKDFPLPNHSWAVHAAVDANCLAAQNQDAYWNFVDTVHASQREIGSAQTMELRFDALDKIALQQGTSHQLDAANLQACVKAQNDAAVKASVGEGESVGVEATPTLFINGQEIEGGAVPLPRLRAALDRALKTAGVDALPPVAAQPSAPQTATPQTTPKK
jgi:protein-disulfide isomerase